jgi:hypothetical protein
VLEQVADRREPEPLELLLTAGPTPGSDSTDAASASARGNRRGRATPSASSPANPTVTPVIEPEEADGTGACMRADHRAERRDDLDLRLRPLGVHHLLQLPRALRRVGVRDADLERRRVVRRRRERRTNSCIAFWLPRTRLSGTTSRSIVRIGFTCSSCPGPRARAADAPPRRRNSSVSTVKIRCACSR